MISGRHGDFLVSRVWRATALVPQLEGAEPRTSLMISELRRSDHLRPWSVRAWTVTDTEGRLAAAVVATRQCFDRWGVTIHVADPNAAAIAATIIDRGPAWWVAGSADDVGPITEHLRRRIGVVAAPWLVSPYPSRIAGDPDDRTRLAGIDDRDALVELFSSFEFRPASTKWQARSWARRLSSRSIVLVADDPDHTARDRKPGLAGAIVVTIATRRYAIVDRLTVVPAHRERGLAWALAARAQSVVNALGLSAAAAIAPSNPMDLGEALDRRNWMMVSLRPPVRVRGQNRLRRWYGRVGALEDRPISLYRDPGDPTRPALE
jgi:hypothetical protein